jgi:hypothetical protein
MKTKRITLPLLACVGLLMGCVNQRELIEKRISQKADFYATLSLASQQRLRDGQLVSGDTYDAAWIVYGRPDRVFQKVTGSSTNELWSYVTQDAVPDTESRPVYHPTRTSRGRSFWHAEPLWASDRFYNSSCYEYRRIEFQNGRVLSLESEQP